jgi:hypothetical protein
MLPVSGKQSSYVITANRIYNPNVDMYSVKQNSRIGSAKYDSLLKISDKSLYTFRFQDAPHRQTA